MARTNAKDGSTLLTSLLGAAVLASIVFVGMTFYGLMDSTSDEKRWTALATELQVDSQKLSMFAGEVALGNLEAYVQLATTRDAMQRAIDRLNLGWPEQGLPAAPRVLTGRMSDLNETWQRLFNNANRIIDRELLVRELAAASDSLQDVIPEIQAATDQVVRQLIESGAANQQVFAASRQLVLADRMLRRVDGVLEGGQAGLKAAEELKTELALFEQAQAALTRGNQRMGITPVRSQAALSSLGRVRNQFERAKPDIEAIMNASNDMFEIRDAADWIFLDSHEMNERARVLSRDVADLPSSRAWPSRQMATVGLAVMVVLVVVLVVILITTQRRRADVAMTHNRRTQKAIMRLLDELSSLGEGDLTVHASVNDQMTGAIADAVNYAVEQLRDLVMGINTTAQAVADSAEATRMDTSQLAQAAREQAGQVDRVSEKIQDMAQSFSGMADRSAQSSETALEAVDISRSGARKVRETIVGMDNIREQIQETSKRIKRLGESSQEIGDIVAMINDIAEQTNVLALNAAIQAASAGSTGKGFAVVADEVQQLAESATNATRRISMLVQTIQVDTAEAVSSMENTTAEVVNGAALAQDAGQALLKIENVSNELSELIQKIAGEAREQSEYAVRISELMAGIRQVSLKTSEGTTASANSVINLADLVQELRRSVADFKLPESKLALEKPGD